jgi:hypothetical protein
MTHTKLLKHNVYEKEREREREREQIKAKEKDIYE